METIKWTDMAMRFTTTSDKCMFASACIGTALFGSVRPLFAFFFGRVTDGVGGGGAGFDSLGDSALMMVYIGIFGGFM